MFGGGCGVDGDDSVARGFDVVVAGGSSVLLSIFPG
jgi:hypothetical protein